MQLQSDISPRCASSSLSWVRCLRR